MLNRIVSALLLMACAIGGAARAEEKPVRVGVLNDMSGVYSDYQGVGSVVAAQMAVEDFGGKVGNRPVEVVSGDHMNKPDVGLAITREWLDLGGVDLVADVPNSSVALAVADLVRQRNKVFLGSGAGTAELTGKACSPNTVHWTYDTWEAGHALAKAVVARGGTKWFLLTADYAFGYDLARSTTEAVRQFGGQVTGEVRHPLGNSDFSSYLLQAQGSGANVLGLENAGGDTTKALKQAAEFGLSGAMTFAGPVININMVQALGLADSQGLLIDTPFYWDMNDGTRAFAERFARRHPRHIMPNDMQAGVYSGVLAYLHAVARIGGKAEDGKAVVEAMKQTPSHDPVYGETTIRVDGRALHPVYVFQTKTPAESKGPWDFFKLVSTVPADQAFRPLSEGHCPLVR
jgi:branched-chain amino acid transport system substrate-binding protein